MENELLEAQSVSLDYDRKIDNLMLQVSKLLDLEIYDEDVNFDYVIDVSNSQITNPFVTPSGITTKIKGFVFPIALLFTSL